MKCRIVSVSSSKDKWALLAEQVYLEKINHYIKIESLNLDPVKGAREDIKRKKEEDSKLILKKISEEDLVVLLDEKGQSYNSIEFSKQLERWTMTNKKQISFIIGGPYGASENLIQRADHRVSLSKMVMNHWIAKIMFLEQIYRAFTIIKNIPYHNA